MGSKPSKPNAGGSPSSSPMSPSGRIMSSRQASASACSRVTARPTPNCSPRPTPPCTRSKTPGAVTSPCTGKCQKRKQRPCPRVAKGCLSCPEGHETTPSVTTALRNIHKQAKAPSRSTTERGLCLCAIGLHSQKATSVSPQTVQTHTHQAPRKEPQKRE